MNNKRHSVNRLNRHRQVKCLGKPAVKPASKRNNPPHELVVELRRIANALEAANKPCKCDVEQRDGRHLFQKIIQRSLKIGGWALKILIENPDTVLAIVQFIFS